MKNLTQILLIVCFGLSGLLVTTAQAQVCMPDSSLTTPGIYPDSIPAACLNQPYATTITVIIPADTLISFPPLPPLTLPIDSIVLDSVLGLPPGITFGCEPPNCQFPGNSISCILISGTPTMADTFDVDIIVTGYLNTPLGPVSQRDTLTSFYTLIVHPALGVSVVSSDASCGGTDGSAVVTATGTGPFSYLWSDGQTTDTASNLAAGIYGVRVIDGNGCSDSISVTVNSSGVNPTVALDSLTFAGCAGSNGGGIFITPSGGTGPYSYAWSNGDTTEDVDGLGGGMYSVTITDALGCAVSEMYTVTDPAPLTLTLTVQTNVTCNGAADGGAGVMASGGGGGYDYEWNTSPPVNTPMIDGLEAGMYGVVVEDSLGCLEDLTVTITQPDSLIVMMMDTSETAPGANDGKATAVVTGGTPPYTYEWANGDSTAAVDSLAPGTYIVEVEDANGCVARDSAVILVSIEDEIAAGINSWKVYPNPNQGVFTLEIQLARPDAMDIRVFDIQGRVVFSEKVVSSQGYHQDISLENVPGGMYLLQVNTSVGAATRRVLVK